VLPEGTEGEIEWLDLPSAESLYVEESSSESVGSKSAVMLGAREMDKVRF
jgi:hypothetical protein